MKNKPYVRIQSTMNIRVTCGLQHNDVTNPDAHVADRLKISPIWPTGSIEITQGAFVYPSEIVEWPTVKALVKDKVLTIGEFIDEPADKAEAQKVIVEDLLKAIAPKEVVEKKLADIAGEEE